MSREGTTAVVRRLSQKQQTLAAERMPTLLISPTTYSRPTNEPPKTGNYYFHMAHLLQRVTILGTGLIGGSFARALRKYTPDMHIVGWDRPEVILEARKSGAIDEGFSESLEPAVGRADLIYIALPIGATLDLLPELAQHAPAHALVTDAGSTKQRIWQAAPNYL